MAAYPMTVPPVSIPTPDINCPEAAVTIPAVILPTEEIVAAVPTVRSPPVTVDIPDTLKYPYQHYQLQLHLL